MSLRTRLALSVGLLVAFAIAVAGALTVVTAEGELVDEVDDFLRERTAQIRGLGDLEARRVRGPIARRADVGDFLERLDAVTQFLDPSGTPIVTGRVELPVDDRDREIAAGVRGSRLRTVTIDGEEYRVMTVGVGVGALQVGRDLAEIDRALSGLTRRTIALTVIGSVLSALVAWVLASRLARPVVRLTETAEHVAATQDLSASIEVTGSDEVARLGASFNTMLGALDTSRRQQHRLVMDASHELRTPLTSLRTNVDVLRRVSTLDDEARGDIVEAIDEEVDELTALVSELVDLATASSRPDEPVVDVDLGSLAESVVARFARRSGRTISLARDRDATVPVRVSMIERALSNIVDNALKFSPAETPVEVTVAGGRVSVRDHGPGIPPADRAHVFDRFYRAVETRSMPGSGLGLAIVREIIETHGGSVFAEDPPDGEGVVIGFDLSPPDRSG